MIRWVGMWSALTANALGKHRGNTEKEVRGNSRKQDTLRNAYRKRISDSPGKPRKLKEVDVFRMAFKRSAVRLRLAPPLKILSCSNYSVADFRGEVTPVARAKHQESTLILSLPPPRGASAKLYDLAFGS